MVSLSQQSVCHGYTRIQEPIYTHFTTPQFSKPIQLLLILTAAVNNKDMFGSMATMYRTLL